MAAIGEVDEANSAIGVALTLLAMALPASASAELPSLLWQSPEDGVPGTGAGRFDNPEGIATDPDTGHVYLADRRNARVMVFDAWGTFVKGWGWGVADGSPELQSCGPGATPPTASCQKGLEGAGPGQFARLLGGIAVDSAGDVYVGDMENHRVQKFDSDGNFLLEFGEAGTGPGQFSTDEFGTYVAASPTGSVFVGDVDRVQEFAADGSFVSEIPFEGDLAELDGKLTQSVAVDGSGNLYITAFGVDKIFKVDSAGSAVAPNSFAVSFS